MTEQDVFDKAAVHLLTQQTKSEAFVKRTNSFMCAYRGCNSDGEKNGLMCAIGCLIDDTDYTVNMEANGTKMLISRFSDNTSIHKLLAINFNFMYDLQNVHDTTMPIDWKEHLIALAEKYQINSDVLNQF